jgi:hypothetical protein
MPTEHEIMARENWPPGPWDGEPDRDEWTDAATGYACCIRRHELFGHLCGYVRLDAGHPLHGVRYSDSVPDAFMQDLEGMMHQPIGHRSFFDVFIASIDHSAGERHRVALLIDVHGSVTFSGGPDDEDGHGVFLPPGFWWGFAAMGYQDLAPGMRAMGLWMRANSPGMAGLPLVDEDNIYRTLPYMREQCESMARQLRALALVFEHMDTEARVVALDVIAKAARESTQ